MRIRNGRYIFTGFGGREPGYHVSDETRQKISESHGKTKRNRTHLNHAYGQKFFDEWDRIHGLPALSIQNSETSNNAVSRDLSNDITTFDEAQTSGDSFSLQLDTTSPDNLVTADSGSQLRSNRSVIVPAVYDSLPVLPDTGAGTIFSKPLTPTPSCAHSNSLKQHHANRGSISRHMITPRGSVILIFPTPPPFQEILQSSQMTEVAGRKSWREGEPTPKGRRVYTTASFKLRNPASSPLLRTI